MTNTELRKAAEFLRKYARAVETKLYMSMKTKEAYEEIFHAERLAEKLDEEAKTQEASQINQNK